MKIRWINHWNKMHINYSTAQMKVFFGSISHGYEKKKMDFRFLTGSNIDCEPINESFFRQASSLRRVCCSRHFMDPVKISFRSRKNLFNRTIHKRQFIFKLDLMFLTQPSKICLFLLKLCQIAWHITKQFSCRERLKLSFCSAAIFS